MDNKSEKYNGLFLSDLVMSYIPYGTERNIDMTKSKPDDNSFKLNLAEEDAEETNGTLE